MNMRLVVAIISTSIEEAAIAVIVLFGLPQFEIEIPLAGLITLMVLWLAVSVILYRIGSSALKRKPVISLPDMIGGRGRVVSPLDPEGLVRIRGELWVAESADENMDVGADIIVVAQDGLKLVVQERKAGDLEETE